MKWTQRVRILTCVASTDACTPSDFALAWHTLARHGRERGVLRHVSLSRSKSKSFHKPLLTFCSALEPRKRANSKREVHGSRRTMGASCVQSVVTIATRIICLSFVVLAGISIPKSLLLFTDGSSVEVEGSTVYVPLLACESVRIQSFCLQDSRV